MEMQNLQKIKVGELEYWPKNPSPFMLYGLKYKQKKNSFQTLEEKYNNHPIEDIFRVYDRDESSINIQIKT